MLGLFGFVACAQAEATPAFTLSNATAPVAPSTPSDTTAPVHAPMYKPGATYGVRERPLVAAVGDLDGDGNQDLAVVNDTIFCVVQPMIRAFSSMPNFRCQPSRTHNSGFFWSRLLMKMSTTRFICQKIHAIELQSSAGRLASSSSRGHPRRPRPSPNSVPAPTSWRQLRSLLLTKLVP